MSNMTLAERFEELNREIPVYLANQHADLQEKFVALSSEFINTAPVSVEDDETEKTMTDLGARINSFLQLCDGQKKNSRRHPAESPKLVDDFYKTLTGQLAKDLEALRFRMNAYKTKKREAAARAAEEERHRVLAEQREAERVRMEIESNEIADKISSAEIIPPAPPPPPAPVYTAPMVKADSGAKSGQIGTWRAKNIDRDILDLEALRPLISQADLEKYSNAYARQYKDTKPLRGAQIVQEFTTTFRGG